MTDTPHDSTASGKHGHAHGCFCCGKGPDVSRVLRMMLPSEAAGEHFKNSAVELLKGFRELIDQRIRQMSQPPAQGKKFTVE